MNIISKQDFILSNSFIWLSRFAALIFVGMTVLSLLLPFFPDEKGTRDKEAVLIVSGVLFILFWGFSIWALKPIKYLPFRNISIDTDGLWYSHLLKERGLISWHSISDIKERPTLQRLDLIGSGGKQLMKVEYQLSHFEQLRLLLSQQVLIEKQNIALPTSFTSGMLTRYFDVGAMVGISVFGWYVGNTGNPLLGYGGTSILVGMLLFEYLTAVWRLELRQNNLVAKYPLSSRRINYEEIKSVELTDTVGKGVRHPEVVVSVRDKKQLKLKGLKVDATKLYAILKKVSGETAAI